MKRRPQRPVRDNETAASGQGCAVFLLISVCVFLFWVLAVLIAPQ